MELLELESGIVGTGKWNCWNYLGSGIVGTI